MFSRANASDRSVRRRCRDRSVLVPFVERYFAPSSVLAPSSGVHRGIDPLLVWPRAGDGCSEHPKSSHMAFLGLLIVLSRSDTPVVSAYKRMFKDASPGIMSDIPNHQVVDWLNWPLNGRPEPQNTGSREGRTTSSRTSGSVRLDPPGIHTKDLRRYLEAQANNAAGAEREVRAETRKAA